MDLAKFSEAKTEVEIWLYVLPNMSAVSSSEVWTIIGFSKRSLPVYDYQLKSMPQKAMK